ncbi:hypothetical protein [Halobacillus naozhouensis]|uniref:Uncharacterized protein n=1 Tax=Halobacillus naozhouensis TaxID=554880 RepID=A0ABY8IXM6_9BACI|nr:hypothetical protein [Halobacillus naozhouensis]WFT73958.1 hypothetical protein P9989_16515 [Halobacillus naozhouensis]
MDLPLRLILLKAALLPSRLLKQDDCMENWIESLRVENGEV